jgi:predicted transcriptional regulator
MDPIDALTQFNLTRQEASLYLALLGGGEMNGYELTKKTGISRSNTYSGLSALVEKGAAWLQEGESLRYRAVPGAEFTANRLRQLSEMRERLLPALPRPPAPSGHHVTILGEQAIWDRLRNMLAEAKERAYLSLEGGLVERLLPELESLAASGCRLTVISDARGCMLIRSRLPAAILHQGTPSPGHIRVIGDSRHVMTGEIGAALSNSCLYSDQPNLVELFKSSLKNEIRLATLEAASPGSLEETP